MRSSTALFNSLLVGVLLSLAVTNIGIGPGMAEAGWGRCRWWVHQRSLVALVVAQAAAVADGGGGSFPSAYFWAT